MVSSLYVRGGTELRSPSVWMLVERESPRCDCNQAGVARVCSFVNGGGGVNFVFQMSDR